MGEEYSLYGSVRIILYSCINASSTSKSFQVCRCGQALSIDWFVGLRSQLYLELGVDSYVQSVSSEDIMVRDQ